MDKGVIILSSNSAVQQFCHSTLSGECSLSLADSWNSIDQMLISFPARLLIVDFDFLQSMDPFFSPHLIKIKYSMRIIILMEKESNFMTTRFIKMGIFDVLPFPCSNSHFLKIIKTALADAPLFLHTPSINAGNLIPNSQESLLLFQKIAKTNHSVLLLGDSGTGKTYTAKRIVELSSRKNEKFITLNCSAIPDSLAESELFGTERGAFTGAESMPGKFEQAHRGTLFLDEVSELSLPVQAKLLKVLETGTFYRLGSSKEVKVDVRFLFATNSDLKQMVMDKKFRFDLYQRISVVQFYLPPLRTQIDRLTYFSGIFLEGSGKTLDREAVSKLKNHTWEGNLRELQNCLVRACLLAETEIINEDHIVFDSIFLTVH